MPLVAILAWAAIPGPGCNSFVAVERTLLVTESREATELVNVATDETLAIDLTAGDCVRVTVTPDVQFYFDPDTYQWRETTDLALCWQDPDPPVRGTNCSNPLVVGTGSCSGDWVDLRG